MLDGHCQTHSLVYKGELKYDIWNPRRHMVENKTKIYFGLASTTFKVRHSNHNTSFNLAAYRKNTALSVEVWRLKDQSINYDLKFSIVKLAPTCSRESKFCRLCLQEKVCILFSSSTDHVGILNKYYINANIGTDISCRIGDFYCLLQEKITSLNVTWLVWAKLFNMCGKKYSEQFFQKYLELSFLFYQGYRLDQCGYRWQHKVRNTVSILFKD